MKAPIIRGMYPSRTQPAPDPRPKIGRVGEQAVVDWTRRRGWRLVARNVRVGRGELDLIAFDRATLVFAEVKTRRASDGRSSEGRATRFTASPLESIGHAKQRQIRRLAAAWIATEWTATAPAARPRITDLRFDAFGVTLARDHSVVRIEHVAEAF